MIRLKSPDEINKDFEKSEKDMLIPRSSIIRLAIKEFIDRRNKSR